MLNRKYRNITSNHKMFKTYQKKFTKLIHGYNKALDEDDIIRGRFHVLQIRTRFEEFDDGSGGILHAVVRCFDKKTRQYKDYCFKYAPWFSTLHWHFSMDIINKFIVEDVQWDIREAQKDKTDYLSIKDYKFDDNDNKHLAISLYSLVNY